MATASLARVGAMGGGGQTSAPTGSRMELGIRQVPVPGGWIRVAASIVRIGCPHGHSSVAGWEETRSAADRATLRRTE